jgi:hypothetical protein
MDPAFRNLLLGLALYIAVAGALLGWIWRRTGRSTSFARRAWCRALAVSCLFSPTVFACGGAMPVPFPLLVAFDLYELAKSAATPCGFQSLPNAILVLIVGIAFGVVHLGISQWQQRSRRGLDSLVIRRRPYL